MLLRYRNGRAAGVMIQSLKLLEHRLGGEAPSSPPATGLGHLGSAMWMSLESVSVIHPDLTSEEVFWQWAVLRKIRQSHFRDLRMENLSHKNSFKC